MRLHFVRHPPPAVAEGLCYGQTDLDLAAPVAELAAGLRARLPANAPVFSSPLRRCRELAAAIHPAPAIDALLLEMHFGAWEMQPWTAIGRAALDAWAADPLGFAPPGGESAGALWRRVERFIGAVEAEAVVVTHAGVIKAASGIALGLPPAEWMRLSFAFGSVTALDFDNTGGAR